MTQVQRKNQKDATNRWFNTPADETFDSQAYQGSLQQLLSENLGNYVTCEFLIGTQSTSERAGILYAVGSSYVVLFDVARRSYVVCDLFSIKFVTFYIPDDDLDADAAQTSAARRQAAART